MSWRLTHLVLLWLAAVAWPHPEVGGAAASTGSPARRPSCVEGREGCERARREADLLSLPRAGTPRDCALRAERAGEPRVELRQPGVRAWLAPASCPSGMPSNTSGSVMAASAAGSRVRLHVLLCTWLN